MKKMRLDKLLSASGYGTRKEVKILIKKEEVLVDHQRVKDPGFPVDPLVSDVHVKGEKLNYKEFYYFMLNKPQGLITATRDGSHDTVMDLFPDNTAHLNLFPVGRLDKDTQGLLLITNDGKWAHNLTSPHKRVPKTYWARIRGRVDEEDITLFRQGIPLEENFTTLPAELVILESAEFSQVLVTLYEGKYHQVKRMFLYTGKEVLDLKRIRMAGLNLDENLEPGQYRELTEDELYFLKNSAD